MDALSHRTVLLVEDEEEIRDILEEILKGQNLNVFGASNGVEALRILGSEEVHAVLSDIAMPEMSGLELLSKMAIEHPEIPTVILTAFGDKENIKEALRLGALDFIEKPFAENEVIDVVTRALEIGTRRKQLSHLSNQSESGDENVNRIFKMQQQKRMIGLITSKNNADRKKRA